MMDKFKKPSQFLFGKPGSIHKLNKKRVWIFLFVLIILLIIIDGAGLSKGVKSGFYRLSEPIQKVFWRGGQKLSEKLDFYYNLKKIDRENKELISRNQDLLSEVARLNQLEEENKALREALNLNLEEGFELILAQLISLDSLEDFLLIDKGKEDDLEEGMPVISEHKILIGRISEVYENQSKVILISNPNSSFSAEILGKETEGIIKGKSGFSVFLDMISQEDEINQGEIVVTSFLGGVFPKGLLVGKVENIRKSDIEPFQKAEISLFFDFNKLKHLFVISNFQ